MCTHTPLHIYTQAYPHAPIMFPDFHQLIIQDAQHYSLSVTLAMDYRPVLLCTYMYLTHSLSLSLSLSLSRTALHCAAYGGFSECVSVLLEEGRATVNLQDLEGITALHWACSTGSLDVVQQLLINAGADPNLMEVDGGRLTPLDYTIIGGHQDVAQLLIENGALSISGIQDLAAIVIQKVVRGFLVRRKYAGVLRAGRKQQEVAGDLSSSSTVKPSEAGVESAPLAASVAPVTSTTAPQDVAIDSGHDRRRYMYKHNIML